MIKSKGCKKASWSVIFALGSILYLIGSGDPVSSLPTYLSKDPCRRPPPGGRSYKEGEWYVGSDTAAFQVAYYNPIGSLGNLDPSFAQDPEDIDLQNKVASFSTTPSGSLVPETGPFAGQTINYEDPRGKHTKFPEYSQKQLKDAVKCPQKSKEQRFADAVKAKNTDYGSQLNSEARKNYDTLVKDALEKGRYDSDSKKVYHKADYPIGIDVETGKGTTNYRLDSVPNGTHVVPLP